MPDGCLPPRLLNSDPEGFAWGVWHDRTPRLVAGIRDAHPYGPEQRDALDALLEEVASGMMSPLPRAAHDHDLWAGWGRERFGRPWAEAPFLWSESYFYRRLLEAVGYFGTGPWRGVDPFGHLKSAELTDPELEADLAAPADQEKLPAGERGEAKLLASLWGNRADLGFRIGRERNDARAEDLVSDDRARLWPLLGPSARVVLVADNAGRELLADLVLIDHLLEHGLAAEVHLHLKPQPYMVSDATPSDLAACVQRLASVPGTPADIAARLTRAAAGTRLRVSAHPFYCAPQPYRDTPADLAAEYAASTLTLMKGDLNYRRLTGDRAWPATTPFTTAIAPFPAPVAALRTLKSDVLTGVPAATLTALDATGPAWRTAGTHALLQLSP
ncbi:damage-control phosphatase ARMT1 family protein [Actinocorallia longicatena]|uniref:Damage-control phosphatase ARMT1 family protein n=1 Tax=Actinocorallia longicatena TaxID=111803 RepID=A0ABP6Q6Q6_9ACTN